MMNSNQKKDATLGMPHGTANNRLRKNILFSLLQKLGEDVCFKCKKKILNVTDLSIEHKEPWEGRSSELFWDLSNIAFSHLHCNTRGKQYSNDHQQRKVGPEGTAWCSDCKDFRPLNEFYKNPSHWNGVSYQCKTHHYKGRGH